MTAVTVHEGKHLRFYVRCRSCGWWASKATRSGAEYAGLVHERQGRLALEGA